MPVAARSAVRRFAPWRASSSPPASGPGTGSYAPSTCPPERSIRRGARAHRSCRRYTSMTSASSDDSRGRNPGLPEWAASHPRAARSRQITCLYSRCGVCPAWGKNAVSAAWRGPVSKRLPAPNSVTKHRDKTSRPAPTSVSTKSAGVQGPQSTRCPIRLLKVMHIKDASTRQATDAAPGRRTHRPGRWAASFAETTRREVGLLCHQAIEEP